MRRPLFSVLFALVAVSCSGGDGDLAAAPDGSTATIDAAAAPSEVGGATESAVDGSTNPTCDLLSTAEVESAVGRVVIATEDSLRTESDDIFGACTWLFEPLTEGALAGESPSLLVQIQPGPEYYEQLLAEFPDSAVAGVGDGAFSRSDGELIFLADGNSGKVGTLFAYDVEQLQEAGTAAEELSRLLADRI